MRIALRTSGGRGEYEVAGSHGSISVADVIDHNIQLQFLPNKIINTNNIIKRLQGKPRIRLLNQQKDKHIYLSIADILLLPKPKRELGKTPDGKLQLTENNYSISSIQFDIVRQTKGSILIQPTNLVLANSEFDLARIDVLERLRIILDVWSKAALGADPLSRNIVRHRDAVMSGNLPEVQSAVNDIRSSFEIEDPLREILRRYSLLDEYTYWMGVHRNDVELSIIDEDLTSHKDAARERVRQWRLQASRGSKGGKFSREVKRAYNNTCLFTGYYLPKSTLCTTSGVDSAHILPWAEYDINSVNNGLCLNKLCHWAFDSGIVVLTYSKSKYELSISDAAKVAEKEGGIGLEGFRKLQGEIPSSRLPADKRHWPSPQFLEEYNKSFSV